MSKPIKSGPMQCAHCLFEKQELNLHIAEWQQDVEDLNLELIDQHELAVATESEAARTFTKELQRRKTNDY